MAHLPTLPPSTPDGATFAFGASPFHAKGVLYLGTQSFFEANLRGGLAAFAADIDRPELRAFITQKFLAASWYDVMPVPALIAYEARALRMELEQYLLHRTRWQAKKDLGGVYGWVLKLASPEMVMSRLPRIFLQMFDFGTLDATPVKDHHARMALGAIPEPLERWLTTAFGVYCDTALKLAGAVRSESRVTTSPDGARAGVPLVKLTCDVSWDVK